ncbi:MAG: protein kinase [bacterium]
MLLGTYTIDERLAKGGMGEVWVGQHAQHGTPVAIKVMTDVTALHADFQDQFRREVESTARLRHPGIVTVYDFGLLPEAATQLDLVENSPYFVMEYLPDGGLHLYRDNFSWLRLRRVLEDVLAALAHAHARGVIHRDIKPDNILVGTFADGSPRTVLTDFGIAYALERNTTTYGKDITARSNEDMSGTPLYMAPEQFRGEFRDYGPWTDLYAIGVVAWEFATGSQPFTGKNPFQLGRAHMMMPLPDFKPRFEVPDGFEKWVRRLLEKEAENRYRTAADANWALKALVDPEDLVTTSEFDAFPSEAELNEAPTMFMPVVLPEGSTEAPPPPRDWRDIELDAESRNLDAGLGLFGLRTIPFVGREKERAALWKAFLSVNDFHKPKAVVVRGLAGTGKSRLAEWLFQAAQECGAAVGFRANHQAEPGAMHGLPWMLTERFRCAGMRPNDILARVERTLRTVGDKSVDDADALTEIMRVDRIDDDRAGTTQISLTVDQRLAVIRRELVRSAGDRVAVVWLDDAAWDQESIALVRTVLELETDPILFILTVREETLAEDPRAREALSTIEDHRRLSTLQVDFFDDETFQHFVRDGLMLTGPAAALVARQCDGSPLYATQLVGFWLSRGSLVVRDGRIDLVDETVVPPKDIANLWQSRLEHLVDELSQPRALPSGQLSAVANPDVVWKRMELAAALGRDVDTDEWEHACKMADLPTVGRLVDLLVEARLAERTAVGFSFVHGLLRDALIKHAHDKRRWKRLNLTCARMLTSRYGQQHPGLAFRVARHFVEAKNATFAQIALNEAFDRESQAAEPRRVIEVCRLMRNAFDRAETKPDPGTLSRLATTEGRALVALTRLHEIERGEALLSDALADVDAGIDRADQARVLSANALAASLRGELVEAIAFGERALALAPDPSTRCEAFIELADLYNRVGDFKTAKQHAAEAFPIANRPDLRIRAHLALARAAQQHQSPAEAEFELESASRLANEHALPSFHAGIILLQGEVLEDMNKAQQALNKYRRASSLLKDTETAVALYAQERLARALLGLNQTEEARVHLNDLERRLHVGERGFGVHPWDAMLAACAVEHDWRAFEVTLQPAFQFEDAPLATRHLRAFAMTCQLLEDARETQRLRRVARHTLECIRDFQTGLQWIPVFESRLA